MEHEHERPRIGHLKYIDISFNAKSDEIRAIIRRDFGLYYKRRNTFTKALNNFTASLAYNPDSVRSNLQFINGKVIKAHAKSSKLVTMHPHQDCEYDKNEFKRTLATCRNVEHHFHPKTNLPSFVSKTNSQLIGSESVHCLLKMRDQIDQYAAHLEACRSNQPLLWKSRLENKECELVNEMEPERIQKEPIKKKRIAQKQMLMNELYMGSETAKDIDFLQKLRHDPRVALAHLPVSTGKIHDMIDTNEETLAIWHSQLYRRKPLYVSSVGSKVLRQQALIRRQYQTRRDIFQQLVYIHKNIENNFETTLHYIENMMIKYYSIKTLRVCPRKVDFITDIFNLVGQTLLERECIVPSELMTLPVTERLTKLLKIPEELRRDRKIDKSNSSYGDRLRFIDPDAPDTTIVPYLKRLRSLELQLKHSDHTEERCYLYYQMAQLHMAHRKMREAVEYSRCLLYEAHNNDLWTLVGYLSAVRSDIISVQYQKAGETLNEMLNSTSLSKCKDTKIHHFCKVVQIIHTNLLKEKCMAALLTMEACRNSRNRIRFASGNFIFISTLILDYFYIFFE